jgi:hypothetical protein
VDSPIAPTILIEITTDKLTFFRHFDRDYLHEQYVVLGKSMNQIARERGCARSTVGAALTDFGFEIKVRKDLRCNMGQVPFGFRIVCGNLVPHRAEKLALDKMTGMRIAGSSYGQIAAWLNSERIKTKNRAAKWDRPTVYKILRNRHDHTEGGLNQIQTPP